MTSTLPPGIPNTFDGAIDLSSSVGFIGSDNRFASIFLSRQLFVAGFMEEVFYKLTVPSGYKHLQVLANEYPAFSSYVIGYNGARARVWDTFGGAGSDQGGPVSTGTFFVSSKAIDASASFDLGLYLLPKDPAAHVDRDLSGPARLGTLSNSNTTIAVTDSLYTVYDRVIPSTSGPSGGALTVLGTKRVDDPKDVFTFTLAQSGEVTITRSGQMGAMLLNLQGNGNGGFMAVNGALTVQLQAGVYSLEIFDTATNVPSGGQNYVAIRQDWELLNDYSFTISFGGGPTDLTARVNSLTPTSIAVGGAFTIGFSLLNSGAAAGGSYGFYLSTDATITRSDRLITFGSFFDKVPANGQRDGSSFVTLPADVAPGTYYIGVIADYYGSVVETNEANNASAGVLVTVTAPPPGVSRNGGTTPDTMSGGAQADTLNGADGDDVLLGLAGVDSINGGAGADYLDGGDGADRIDTGAAASGYDIVFGGAGPDIVNKPGPGAAYVKGGDGDDAITMGNGRADPLVYDYVFGDAGNDVILKSGTGRLYVEGGAGDDSITGGTQVVAAPQVSEYLIGDGGSDTIAGRAGDDVLVGSNYGSTDPDPGLDPIDFLDGGPGNDFVLQGAWGRGSLTGGDGADTIVGAAKADTLIFGKGDDYAYGGGGGDLFIVDVADLEAGGVDRFIDFYFAGSQLQLVGIAPSRVSFSQSGDFALASISVGAGYHTIAAGYVSAAQLEAQTLYG